MIDNNNIQRVKCDKDKATIEFPNGVKSNSNENSHNEFTSMSSRSSDDVSLLTSSSLNSSLRIKTQCDSLQKKYQPSRRRINKAILVSAYVFLKILYDIRRKREESEGLDNNNIKNCSNKENPSERENLEIEQQYEENGNYNNDNPSEIRNLENNVDKTGIGSAAASINNYKHNTHKSLFNSFSNQYDHRDPLMNKSPFAFTTTTNNKRTSKIRFSHVDVHVHKTIATNNPAVSSGPAIGIGWEYESIENIPIDEYEKEKEQQCGEESSIFGRRKDEYDKFNKNEQCDLRLSEEERCCRLKDAGYSEKEIKVASKRSEKAKKKRRKTIDSLKNVQIHEQLEAAAYKIQTIVRLRQKDTDDIDKLSKRVVAIQTSKANSLKNKVQNIF